MQIQRLLNLPGEGAVLLEVSMRAAFIRTMEWFGVKGTLEVISVNRDILD